MIEPKHDGTPEERSAFFREMQKESRKTYKGTGGFHALKKSDPERFKNVTSKGGKKGTATRWTNEKS